MSDEKILDTETGMTYCAGDEEFYHEVLKEYLDSSTDRERELDAALSEDDMERYSITVHSLKSMSRTIGAKKTAALAQNLEALANDKKTEEVAKGHKTLMASVREVTELIRTMGIS